MQPFEILFRPYFVIAIAFLGKLFGLWTSADAKGLSSFLFGIILPVIVFTSIVQADLSTFDNMQALFELISGFIALPLAYLAYRTHGKPASTQVSPDAPSHIEVLPGEREMLMCCCFGFESSVSIPFVLVNLGPESLGRFISQDYLNFCWAFGVLHLLSQFFMKDKEQTTGKYISPTELELTSHEDENLFQSTSNKGSNATNLTLPDIENHSHTQPQIKTQSLKDKYPRFFLFMSIILFPPIVGFWTAWVIKAGLQKPGSPGEMGPGLFAFMQGYLANGFDVYIILFLAASVDFPSLRKQIGQWAYWKVHIVRIVVGFIMWCLTNFNYIPFKERGTRNVMLFGFFGSVPSVTIMYSALYNPRLLPIISYTTVLSLILAFLTMLFSALVGTYP